MSIYFFFATYTYVDDIDQVNFPWNQSFIGRDPTTKSLCNRAQEKKETLIRPLKVKKSSFPMIVGRFPRMSVV